MEKEAVLQRVFGYSGFRPGQEVLVEGVLSGKDVFGILPTGGGKSICYQLPALMLPGITLVISPLISLMKDQVMALKAGGIPAAYINSTLNDQQMQAVYRNLRQGKYKIVYVAPERLDYGGFAQLAARLHISFLAVDEAHCISQWGQDFRPSYLRIPEFVDALPRRPVVGAYTATATAAVREDVERILKLKDPVRTVTGFDRPNLFFEVLRPRSKDGELLQLLEQRRDKSGIVYCATRKKVEDVCQLLRSRGYRAGRYHAGLPEEERSTAQEDFLYDRISVMVATNAFGMGIDKSNVSFVIHYNMPKSMEAYYQEAGRAGRDGTAADCILLFSQGDVQTARFLIEQIPQNDALDPRQRELVQQQEYRRLESMVDYCKTDRCLRCSILDYFGQSHGDGCDGCANCRDAFETVDITKQAQMILACVRRIRDKLGYSVGAATVARVLQGSREKKLLQLGLDTVSTYGLMKQTGRSTIRAMMEHLEREGYLLTEQEHQTQQLTEAASRVLFHGEQVFMRRRKEEEQKEDASPMQGLRDLQADLYEQLRALRAELAREGGIPPFMIFSNATLTDMARRQPVTESAFRKVSGVGEIKAAWYAKPFLACIRDFLKEQGQE